MEKKFTFCATKKFNILTEYVRKKNSERNTNHNLPLQVKWSVPNQKVMANKIQKMHCISLDKNSTFMSTPTEILFSAL